MVKILVTNAKILTMSEKHELLIDRGFIYLRDGRVEAVGKGEPPEELRYPELLISGEGRLVTPGLSSAITAVSLYPLRYRVNDLAWNDLSDYMSMLTRTDLYYLAALSFMELVSRGVTSALVADVFLDNVARAANDVGIYVTLAVPYECGIKDFEPESEVKLLLSRWHERVEGVKAAVLYCGDPPSRFVNEMASLGLRVYALKPRTARSDVISVNPVEGGGRNVIRYGRDVVRWSPEEGLGIGVRPSYSMVDVVKEVTWRLKVHPLDVIAAASTLNTKLLGFSNMGSLDVSSKANIVMFNTSEPPGWPAPSSLEPLVRAIVEGDLRVETVIVNDDVLVDGGETLTVGTDIVRRAVRRLGDLIKKFV